MLSVSCLKPGNLPIPHAHVPKPSSSFHIWLHACKSSLVSSVTVTCFTPNFLPQTFYPKLFTPNFLPQTFYPKLFMWIVCTNSAVSSRVTLFYVMSMCLDVFVIITWIYVCMYLSSSHVSMHAVCIFLWTPHTTLQPAHTQYDACMTYMYSYHPCSRPASTHSYKRIIHTYITTLNRINIFSVIFLVTAYVHAWALRITWRLACMYIYVRMVCAYVCMSILGSRIALRYLEH